ncbi:MAG: hypothetical protein Q7T35_01410 [Nitrosomonas sp.]|nr:hypothetical protein [Nitrosomonas sp.]
MATKLIALTTGLILTTVSNDVCAISYIAQIFIHWQQFKVCFPTVMGIAGRSASSLFNTDQSVRYRTDCSWF